MWTRFVSWLRWFLRGDTEPGGNITVTDSIFLPGDDIRIDTATGPIYRHIDAMDVQGLTLSLAPVLPGQWWWLVAILEVLD